MKRYKHVVQEQISVIVPVYNVEPFLNRCIQSIVDQTYRKLEIILIDDGSTDNSGKMCDKWAAQDPRIRVIHQVNGGLSDARNHGMRIACGNYIGFVDSDDWLESNMFESLYRLIKKYHADISMCAANSVDLEGKVIGTGDVPVKRSWDEAISLYRNKEIMEAHLSKRNLINAGVWNKLYKKEVLKDIEFPKGKLYEDMFTTYRILAQSKVLVKTAMHGYNYLQREGSICKKKLTANNFDSLEANRERYQFVLEKFPEFETMARERMLTNLLNLAFRIVKEAKTDCFREQIKYMRRELRQYSLSGCDLNTKQWIGLKCFAFNENIFSILTSILYK